MVMVAEKPRTARVYGDTTDAFGADPSNPRQYEFRYKLLDMSDVVVSHNDTFAPNPDYPKELQPRLRDRAASKVQIGTMAANLNPRVLLHDSGFLDTGPMIVGADNVVESGNGRMLALRKASRDHRDKYRLYVMMLKTNARKYGLNPEDVETLKAPVLVRERITPVDRVQFASEANVGAVMRMSPYEQALQDAGRLSDQVIGNLQIGEDQSIEQALRSPANKHMVTHFVSTLPANERATIAEARGTINQAGLDRLKLAIFAKTYTGEAGQRLTRIFGENVDPIVKSIENSVFQALPDMAKAESLIGAGYRDPDLSIGEDLAEVIDTYASLKAQSLKVSDYLAQAEMFEERLTPFQKAILQHLDDIARKPKVVRGMLRDVARQVIDAPARGQVAMMGFSPPTKEDIVNETIQRQRQELELPPIPITAAMPASTRLEESDRRGATGTARVAGEVRATSPPSSRAGEEQSGSQPIAMARGTSAQVGLAGLGKEQAQAQMLGEFGAYASREAVPLVDVEAMKAKEAAKPLPGQTAMLDDTPPEVLADYPELQAKAEEPKRERKPKATAKEPSRARRVTVTVKKPKERKAKGEEPTTMAEVARVQAGRSDRAIQVDKAKQASEILPVNKARRWLRHPNRCDVRGVDTPGTLRPVKQSQPKGPGVMQPNGRIQRQKRGSVI